MIDLASNFNRLGAPVDLIGHLADTLANTASTYAGDSMGVVDMTFAAEYFNVAPESIAITDGSTEAFSLVLKKYAGQPVYVYQPTFWEYAFFAKEAGSKIVYIPAGDDVKEMLQGSAPGVVILCNPNNPTGHMLSKDAILSLAQNNPNHTFVVDETYLWFAGDYRSLSASRFVEQEPNIIVVTSLSKICTVPGLRVGLIFASDGSMKEKVPYSVLPIQIEALRYALSSCEDFLQVSYQGAAHDRAAIVKYLDSRQEYEYLEPHANFVFIKAAKPGLAEHMLAQSIRVRGGKEFGEKYKNYIRMRLPEENSDEWNTVVTALNSFMN